MYIEYIQKNEREKKLDARRKKNPPKTINDSVIMRNEPVQQRNFQKKPGQNK